MATPDLTPQIEAAAAMPQEATADGQTVRQQPLADLVEADRYLKGQDAVKRRSRGLRFTRLVPPGAV